MGRGGSEYMNQVKASQFAIPQNPTPAQLEQYLAICSNHIARLSDMISGYKTDVSIKDTAYKRAVARAIVKYRGDGTPANIVSKVVEGDDEVIATKDALDAAEAIYTIAKGEFDGWDSHFVALRKISEIRKQEMRSS